jgi:cell division protein FtsL
LVSPADPRRQPRPHDIGEEPAGDELLHDPRLAPREGQNGERHLYLVRQQARRRANRRHLLVSAGIGAVAIVSMGLVGLHVLIAENQFRLDNLEQQANTQQASYEKLRLSVAQLESPARIVSVAEGELGMQQPGSVTYLPATSTPAGNGSYANTGPTSGESVTGGTVSAPEGDADWPSIKPYLSGSP